MIEFHKAAFETYYNSILFLQEQTTKSLENMLKQSPWIPAQTKSFINEWIGIYKKVTEDFKETVDKNYAKLKNCWNPLRKNHPKRQLNKINNNGG